LLGEEITLSFIASFTDIGLTQMCNMVEGDAENDATQQ
jgi:hypothetical protein